MRRENGAHSRNEPARLGDLDNVLGMASDWPTMDGSEVVRHLKADPATAWVPVIARTAHALLSDQVRSLDVGCDEFETTPVDVACWSAPWIAYSR